MNMTNLVFISDRNYYGFDWEVYRCKKTNGFVGICHGFSSFQEAKSMPLLKEKMVGASRDERRSKKKSKR